MMMTTLNEVYFGRKPLEPIRNQLDKIRIKVAAMNSLPATINSDPEILKFNSMMAKFFGFKSYTLHINPSQSINAYAIPVGCMMSNEEKLAIYKSLVANPTGFKYENVFPGVGFIMDLNFGLIKMENITTDDLMGVLLHEVGHGFFEAVTDPDGGYTVFNKTLMLLKSFMRKIKIASSSRRQITQNEADSDISSLSSTIKDVKDSLIKKVKSTFFREAMADNFRNNMSGYTNEKFADTFAAMYGYGFNQQSSLMKMYQEMYSRLYPKAKKYSRLAEIFKVYKLLARDAMLYALHIKDEHPEDLARLKVTMDYIKSELSKESLDPALKRELVSQLEELNKLLDEYINYPKDNDSMRIYRLYCIALYKKFGGDRREKDFDSDAFFKSIDDRYNQLTSDGKDD